MLKNMIFSMIAVTCVSLSAFAETYNCTLSPVTSPIPAEARPNVLTKFTINTNEQDHASAKIEGLETGCVVYRSSPQLLSCYISGSNESTPIAVATAELGGKMLAVSGSISDGLYQTFCSLK